MTNLGKLAAAIGAFLLRWGGPIAAVVLAVLLARSCSRADTATREATRVLEAEKLRAQKVLVAEQERRQAVTDSAARLAAQNLDLAAEIKRLREAAPGSQVDSSGHFDTGGVVAGGTPRPVQCPPPAPVLPGASCPVPPPACLLAVGDTGAIRIDQVQLRTEAGNVVVAGEASAWRLLPEPSTRLFGGRFDPQLSHLEVVAPRPAPGWGGGLWARGATNGTGALGGAIALPPLRIGFLGVEQVELTAGVGGGTAGLEGMAVLIGRGAR